MNERILLLSIHPKHVQQIFSRGKTVELRKVAPNIQNSSLVIIYATSPVKAIVGAFRVSEIMIKPPEKLWRHVRYRAAITKDEFNIYFNNYEKGVALFFHDIFKLKIPIKLNQLRKKWPNFHPPRVHCYLNGSSNKEFIIHLLQKM